LGSRRIGEKPLLFSAAVPESGTIMHSLSEEGDPPEPGDYLVEMADSRGRGLWEDKNQELCPMVRRERRVTIAIQQPSHPPGPASHRPNSLFPPKLKSNRPLRPRHRRCFRV